MQVLRQDYSLAEQALGFWASLTLGIMAVTSWVIRYVTDPVVCFFPAQYTPIMERYAIDTCFQQTMVMEWDKNVDMFAKRQRTYHQWVPVALGFGAVLCLLPHVVWRMLGSLLWLDAQALAQTLADNQRQNGATRHVMLKDCALLVMAGLRGGSNCVLAIAALARKALACAVCVLQIVLVVVVFGPPLSPQSEDWEANAPPKDKAQEREEKDYNASVPLPEHVLCEFNVHTIQSSVCRLPLNPVFRQAFTFLFYVFLLLALCCMLDLFTSLGRLAIPGLRDSSLLRYLAVSQPAMDPQMTAGQSRFLDALGMDGRLLLTVTADLSGPVAAADLACHLWTAFMTSARPSAVQPRQPGSEPPPGAMTTVPPSAPHPPPSMVGSGEAVPLLPMGGAGVVEGKPRAADT